jgi:hypothetical protein
VITKKRLVSSGLIVLLLGYFVVPSTFDLVRFRWRVAAALKHARTIRLEEFQGYTHRRVLSSVDLKGEEIGAALAALPYAPDVSFPGMEKMCAFVPHHRIVAVAQDGTTSSLEVCFTCGDLSLINSPDSRASVMAMPFAWWPFLHRLFTGHGIPIQARYNDIGFDFGTPK